MTSRLRFSEHVPPLGSADSRRLGGLPSSWSARINPDAPLALERRGRAVASALRAEGRAREAAELLRAVELLERVEELHGHAQLVETLTQLYGSFRTFMRGSLPSYETPEDARAQDAADEASMGWRQSGMLGDPESSAHGPAFCATAALRSRAFRLVEAMIAKSRRTRV